ncbi:unnamed protein product [Blepharisma stoltei]|uniref:Uncharacterized protein n=1 Tax=Blepharisma stoltei TaxID=1481888 RepID=A0AAU9JUX5_9CILI|nr:unnamed protein product [Blepharisma stoltei]
MGACYGSKPKPSNNKKICPLKIHNDNENMYESLKIEGQKKRLFLKKALEAPLLNITENDLYQRRASRWQNEMYQSCSNLEQSTSTNSLC